MKNAKTLICFIILFTCLLRDQRSIFATDSFERPFHHRFNNKTGFSLDGSRQNIYLDKNVPFFIRTIFFCFSLSGHKTREFETRTLIITKLDRVPFTVFTVLLRVATFCLIRLYSTSWCYLRVNQKTSLGRQSPKRRANTVLMRTSFASFFGGYFSGNFEKRGTRA